MKKLDYLTWLAVAAMSSPFACANTERDFNSATTGGGGSETGGSGGGGGSGASGGTGATGGSGGSVTGGSGGTGGPACEELPPAKLALYLVLDRSAAMATVSGTGTRWSVQFTALDNFLKDGASTGLHVAAVSSPKATLPCDEATYTSAAVAYGDLPAHASAITTPFQTDSPSGSATMLAAVGVALASATQLATDNPEYVSDVVLSMGTIGSACAGYELSALQTALSDAVDSAAVRTWIVNAGALDLVAEQTILSTAGGTPVLDVTPSEALAQIRDTAAACQFQVPNGFPAGDQIYMDGAALQAVSGAANCSNATQYYLDSAAAPTMVFLCPLTCDALASTVALGQNCG
jgi:hypothetical protein